MKTITILFQLYLLVISAAYAGEASLVRLDNPRQSTGIEIGDVLERQLVIESSAEDELPKSALPKKGERIAGVELVDVSLQHEKAAYGHRYLIKLIYQVFAAGDKPSVMRLPEFALLFSGGASPVEVHVPAWQFWFSPLVTGNIHTARSNVQPQRKPSLLDVDPTRLVLALGVVLIGVGGLVYINADRRWLPWMGGSFAQAYRQLRKSSSKKEGHIQALGYIHQAFNQVYGRTLFRQELNDFLNQYPHYQPLAGEIDGFFQRSEALLFAHQNVESSVLIKDLQQLCRRLRDCERKLA